MLSTAAFGRCVGNATSWNQREPTLAEILSDPIVVAVMKADRVDPVALEAQLQP